MKFLEKNRGFMQLPGLGQGELVAINVFDILKLFSLVFLLETFARSQRAQFSLCLKQNSSKVGRLPRIFLG